MFRPTILLATLLSAASVADAQVVVYDNTTTYAGTENLLLSGGQSDSSEHGNEITLRGANRSVTAIHVVLRIQGAGPATFDARVRLYRNDGPGGMPGTALWSSALTPRIIDSGAPLQYSFVVPEIVVPETFTWTIEVQNRTGNSSELGPSHFDPPTTGSARSGYWKRIGAGPTDWELTGLAQPPFGARITAIGTPIPALTGWGVTVLMIALMGAGIATLRRRSAARS